MPRQARIDIPGHLYHVIARGIERRKIFIADYDYEDFLSRLERALDKTGSKCFAFSLLVQCLGDIVSYVALILGWAKESGARNKDQGTRNEDQGKRKREQGKEDSKRTTILVPYGLK